MFFVVGKVSGIKKIVVHWIWIFCEVFLILMKSQTKLVNQMNVMAYPCLLNSPKRINLFSSFWKWKLRTAMSRMLSITIKIHRIMSENWSKNSLFCLCFIIILYSTFLSYYTFHIGALLLCNLLKDDHFHYGWSPCTAVYYHYISEYTYICKCIYVYISKQVYIYIYK